MKKEKHKSKYYVPNILKQIDLSGDVNDISKLENMMSCIFSAPIMFIAAVFNFILRFVVWHESLTYVIVDTLILCSFGIILLVILRIKLNMKLTTFLISAVFSLCFVFVYIRYINILGPLIWIGACLQLALVIPHIKKDVAIYNGLTIISVSIYAYFNPPTTAFYLNKFYYGMQVLLIFVFFLVVCGANQVHFLRYKIIREQLKIVVKQKHEISSLYQEVAEAEEELRQQNDTLIDYNIKLTQSEEKLKFLAYHDMLTELPNRKMIYEELENLMMDAKILGTNIYVVFIDIDYFKNINDKLGHHVGDIFINEAAIRLKSTILEDDLLGRTGGDEFTLIIPRNVTPEEVMIYLDAIREKFSEDFIIQNTVMQSTASFGVSIYPKDGEDIIVLMKKSDMAMYKAKELGKNRIQFYEQEL